MVVIETHIHIGRALSIAVGTLLIFLALGGGASAEPGLVAEYHFDGNAIDSSGNGNDGTINGGAAFVGGVSGQALSFDGVNDYVGRGDTPSLELQQFTIEAWIQLNSNNPQVAYEYSVEGSNCVGKGIELRISENKLYGRKGSGDGNWAGEGVVGSTNMESGTSKWYHIVYSYDGSTQKVYVNGQLDGSNANPQSITYSGLNAVNIGREDDSNGDCSGLDNPHYYFKGLIDEVRIYNRALSANEIKAEYEKYSGLVAEYHFDGDAKDSSGNGNHGTINGATFTQGISGQALSFDGVNNYVEVIGTTLSPPIMTLELWLKADSTDAPLNIVNKAPCAGSATQFSYKFSS